MSDAQKAPKSSPQAPHGAPLAISASCPGSIKFLFNNAMSGWSNYQHCPVCDEDGEEPWLKPDNPPDGYVVELDCPGDGKIHINSGPGLVFVQVSKNRGSPARVELTASGCSTTPNPAGSDVIGADLSGGLVAFDVSCSTPSDVTFAATVYQDGLTYSQSQVITVTM